jgi:putative transposase
LTWRTFLKAHWPAVVAADFFTTETWTARGLVTYYTLFVIELASRRVHAVGSTPHPDEAFMLLADRQFTNEVDGVMRPYAMLICDRDRKWSRAVFEFMRSAGVQVVQTTVWAPNCYAYAERSVRSIQHECLNRVIPLAEGHLRRTIAEYLVHYHRERNHQRVANELLIGPAAFGSSGAVRRRQRMGGILNYDDRAA